MKPPVRDSSSTDYEPDTILVRFRPEAARGLSGSNFLPGTDLQPEISLVPGLHVVHLSSGVTVPQALAAYRSSALVQYAEPNFRVHAVDTIPNDPMWNNSGLYGLRIIQAPAAWDINVGSGNTVIASIDTGVDYNHPDLQNNMWTNPADGSHGWNYISATNNPLDDNGHGSHTSGTMAAEGDNGIGVVGVNWHAQIMALKILDSQGTGNSGTALTALDYAVQNGATISNNSYGCNLCFSQAMVDGLQNAAAVNGHIFVAAAGNDSVDIDVVPFYPAGYSVYTDNVIAVAATDSSDNRAYYSNFGPTTVQLGAPGDSVLSTWMNGQYATASGTSMASPHVAGAVALIRDTFPDMTYQDVISTIISTTDPNTSLSGLTVSGGRLNLGRAMGALGPGRSGNLRGAFQAQLAQQIRVTATAWPPNPKIVSDMNGITLDQKPPVLSDLIIQTPKGAARITNARVLPASLDSPPDLISQAIQRSLI
ncbi:MAG TPA: S8 family peptidase [Gemmataceae bacterium]|nr:S8 family peptidase [Gemmataceae bacterium]